MCSGTYSETIVYIMLSVARLTTHCNIKKKSFYFRKYGSSIEKKLYEDMTITDFINRLMNKRAATFMKAQDQYKLITGETG